MNLFKSIQLIVLASFAMTSVVPTVVLAAPGDRRPAANNRRPAIKSNNVKNTKKSFWKRITDNWEYVALGGCAVVGIAALLWTMNNKAAGQAPKPNPFGTINPNDPDLQIGEGDCVVCYEDTKDRTRCCNNPVCRKCWNTPVKGGDTEYVDANIGLRIVDKGKVLPQTCPICRKAKTALGMK